MHHSYSPREQHLASSPCSEAAQELARALAPRQDIVVVVARCPASRDRLGSAASTPERCQIDQYRERVGLLRLLSPMEWLLGPAPLRSARALGAAAHHRTAISHCTAPPHIRPAGRTAHSPHCSECQAHAAPSFAGSTHCQRRQSMLMRNTNTTSNCASAATLGSMAVPSPRTALVSCRMTLSTTVLDRKPENSARVERLIQGRQFPELIQ
jgi:hypothetical protein